MVDKLDKNGKNKQRRASSRPFITLVALSFAMIIGLGFFRFSNSQLEHRLSSLDRSLERYTSEETELKRTLSSLTSPIRIYSHCKDKLGMTAGRQDVVRVQRVNTAHTTPVEPQRGWRSSMLAFFGLTMN